MSPAPARAMPADVQTERSLLGAVVLAADLSAVADVLVPEDFYGDDERRVYESMRELHRQGEPIDVNVLQNMVGNTIVVSDYVDGLPRNPPIKTYAAGILERSSWRRMARLGTELSNRALAADGDPADLARSFAVDLGAIASTPNGHPENTFEANGEGRYKLLVPSIGAELEVDFLRRESSQLKAELMVRCKLPGARTHGGVLSVSDLNLSSSRSRSMHGKHLDERAHTKGVFVDVLEELAQRVLAAEREGQPAVLLHELPRPTADEALDVEGFTLLARHPVIAFGDGGAAKSYLALYIAGTLAQRGRRVAFFDWELAGEDHRDRLERLFGSEMPRIHYVRAVRPLVYEADRLRRIVRDEQIDYCIFDSVAFACDGPPEAAEVAGRYFQALRQIGPVGSLHVAHVTKAFEGADRKPFGSVFWHNGARGTWNVKLAETSPDESFITVGLFNRKANLGALRPAVGFEFGFSAERTRVRPVKVEDVADLAQNMTIADRMRALLRRGPRPIAEIAEALDAPKDTIKKTVNRKTNMFVRVPGQGADVIALADRRGDR